MREEDAKGQVEMAVEGSLWWPGKGTPKEHIVSAFYCISRSKRNLM